ncbi:MAG: putative sugar O-methyltransferase [Bacteroidetes bacterium]|nr:putative sugar O-methyltransferase [Bacteroidota bacterium]
MAIQVQDNFKLLDMMNQDMENAPDLYKPTNYWSYKANFLQPALKEEGLKDFRRKRISVYASIGGVDVYPDYLINVEKSRLLNNRVSRAIPGWNHILKGLNGIVNSVVNSIPAWKTYLLKKPYRFAKKVEASTGAVSVDQFEASMAGNPEYHFEVNGKHYTNNIFDYYLRYAFCCRFINFKDIKVIVELGSGSCKLTEVVKKLHPHITFLNFDISPQLYVGERYLDTVFPGDVISYEKNRELTKLPELQPGKIYTFGSWQFPLLENFKFDLFFNLTSFQEMEPHVVANYIRFINGNAQYVYLHEKMDGKEVARKQGEFGVIEPTKLSHYEKGFDQYQLLCIEDSRNEYGDFKWKGHKDGFWKLKSKD